MRKSGFTLVEILIVVIILGILAAIVIPQFTNASEDARRSSLASQLQTIRSQIELYKLEHHDALPDLVAGGSGMWTLLTQQSDEWGVVPPPAGAPVIRGPYLQAIPNNPLVNSTTIVNGNGAGAALGVGFIYDYGRVGETGKFWGVQKNDDGSYGLFTE